MPSLTPSPIARYEGDDGPVAVIPFQGALNGSTHDIFQQVLETTIREFNGQCDVILDLGGIDEMTSVCIGILMAQHEVLASADHRLLVANASPVVEEVLRLVHVDTILPNWASVDEALDACGV